MKFDTEDIRRDLERKANEMIQGSSLRGFWEFCMGPLDIEIVTDRESLQPRDCFYVDLKMATPSFYLSPLAGAPC